MSVHWIGKCRKVHPQLRPKHGKRDVQDPAKKEDANKGVSPMTIILEAVLQKYQLSRSIRLIGLVNNGYHFCIIEVIFYLTCFAVE
jgi:hypothetical protein